MSFSFSFSCGEGWSSRLAAADAPTTGPTTATLRPATEHALTEIHQEAAAWPVEEVPVPGNSNVKPLRKRLLPEARLATLLEAEALPAGEQSPAASGDMSNSDLLRDVYEGGFKLWECARDLLQVISEDESRGELKLRGASVLEVGCGAGLPGMLTMQLGAAELLLQDFNPGVLRAVTMPALQLNSLWARAEAGDVRLLGGDWTRVSARLSRETTSNSAGGSCLQALFPDSSSRPAGFDLILTADTIYSVEATPRLWNLIREQALLAI